MSLISNMARGATGNGTERPSSLPSAPQLPARPSEPHRLGTKTIQAVDQLTSMSADEIEKVARQVVEAAQEIADVLREAARRVRENGRIANERLGNFVRVASTCADAARLMQQSVAHRDDPQPDPAEAIDKRQAPPTDLDALAARIRQLADECGITR